MPAGGRARPAKPRPSAPDQRKAAAAAPAASEPAAPVKVTDSLKRSVEHAYEYYADPDAPLKDVLDKICVEFALPRKVVHEIISPIHTARLRERSAQLSQDTAKQVGAQYEAMMIAGSRPAGGRRKQIARDLLIPAKAVMAAVGQWSWRHHDPRQLSRVQKFQIERTYWEHIHRGDPDDAGRLLPSLTDVVQAVAHDLGMPWMAVARWVDVLHDDIRPLSRAPGLTTELEQAIRSAYLDYLDGQAPPTDSLHRTLSDRFNCSVREVHRALLLYRWQERIRGVQTNPEEAEMVRPALSHTTAQA